MVTAFLSYRQESTDHNLRVRDLAERLEKEGITVVLDQFAQEREFNHGGPDEGWPQWCLKQADSTAHKTLIIASAGWFDGFENAGPAKGLGSASEARVILQRLYAARGLAKGIRLVAFSPDDLVNAPSYLEGLHCFSQPRDFTDLVAWLKGGAPSFTATTQGWPKTPPELKWPVADHSQAREAFAQLITRGSDHRLLPIQGSSETGKSLLTRQILRNALALPGLACGRLDFKGTTDIAQAVNAFVQHLEIEPPHSSLGLTAQLSQILKVLTDRKEPALLVFDTFELAGNAEVWMKESLLPRLMRADWLRVVVAGQRVPHCHNEPGAEFCHRVIDLAPPGPEDWFAYGKENNKPDLTLEKVSYIHLLSKGKSSLMAQMLGPAA